MPPPTVPLALSYREPKLPGAAVNAVKASETAAPDV